MNPVTGEPYAPNVVKRGDYARVLAEFWADGPRSETPPGHWNTLANAVVDRPASAPDRRRPASELDPLEWDVKMYFALNGAVHDAAIAAWGVKGYYDSVRPISMIRYMGGSGQSSDPDGPSYNADGLPLEPGLIEVITRRVEPRRASGTRQLAGHEGEIADPRLAGQPRGSRDAASAASDWILRRRVGAVPAADVRHAGVRRATSRATARSAARRPRC